MALCLIAPAATAQLGKKQEKQIAQNAKKRAKELKKEGYKIMGTLPLEDALIKHYTLVELGAAEQPGEGRSKSKNNGRSMCLTNALNEYASKAVSQVQGMAITDQYGNAVQTENEPEFDRFYQAFERMTEKEIQGELQESFTIFRELPDGSYEFTMYMTVDPKKAKISREKALQGALKESQLAQQYAKQIQEHFK